MTRDPGADGDASLLDEISLKSAYWTSAVLDARLAEAFGREQYGPAAHLLAALAPDPACSEEADKTACRLMLAAIRASEGDLAKLRMWVLAARTDPRDLIGAAEYPRELAEFSEEAREADLAAYLGWVRGTEGQSKD
jgi:hypothetical protein